MGVYEMLKLDCDILKIEDATAKCNEISPEAVALFFQGAAQCLDDPHHIDSLLGDFFAYVRRFVPVTSLTLGRSRLDTRMLDTLAMCTLDQNGDVELHMLLSKVAHTIEQLHSAEAGFAAVGDPTAGVMVTSPDDPFAHFMTSGSVGLPRPVNPPFFFLQLKRGNTVYGGAVFTCSNDNPFTLGHLELLRSLHVPLLMGINNWFQYNELKALKEQIWQENIRLRQQLHGVSDVNVIGASGGLRRVMEKVRLAGPTDVPVLITGETGTGKEVIARAVHSLSSRHDKPFVDVNCGGIPPSLIDSELFGHVKGAFTGAASDHKGRFERAKGGTIFLDEIGELPLDVQARLLRVLQERTIERVGGHVSMPVDFRLIAATNRDLEKMVEEGSFREDLYYRLRVLSLRLPPLRERKQDIPLLVDHLLRRSALRLGILAPDLAPGEMSRLTEYRWPGNVRELHNVLEEALVLMPQGPLHFWAEDDNRRSSNNLGEVSTLDEALADYFRRLLNACNGRISGPGGAAEKANINSNTLRAKLIKLGIPYGRSK